MKKIFYLLILLTVFASFAFTTKAYCEDFDLDSAKNYLIQGRPSAITGFVHTYYLGTPGVESIVNYYDSGGGQIGFLAKYSGEPNISYFYALTNTLQYVNMIFDSPNVYPQRSYRYNTSGVFQHMDLYLSPSEYYGFDANGNYDVHSVGGVLYDPDNKKIGSMSDIIKF